MAAPVCCRLERRKAEKAMEDVFYSKRDAARASMKEAMSHAGALATASAPETAEGAEAEEEGEGGVPEWLEHSDGRFSPPLLPADAVAGDLIDEEDDRELLMAARTQVRCSSSFCSGSLVLCSPPVAQPSVVLAAVAASDWHVA